jgi:perosamine synthetase
MSTTDVDAPHPAGGTAAAASIAPAAAAFVSGPQPVCETFPAARAPVSPVLSWSSFFRRGGAPVPSILDAGQVRHVTSGRVAIAMALRAMQIGPGDKVLVPSYHCASMIEPVIWAGATPVFYKVKADTSVDFDDIAAKVDASTKLICAANYFGFPQPLAALRAFADARGLRLLEDCAHCFLGTYDGKPVGSFGDYAIASSMKFFPIYEGGALVSARHSLAGITLEGAGLGFEAKMALNTLEEAFQFGRLGLVKFLLGIPMGLKNFLWGYLKARRGTAVKSMAPGSSEGAFGFDPGWIGKRSARFTRFIMRTVSRRHMAAMRRQNYLTLQAALAGLPGCRPLFPELPANVVPWGFPLQTDNPQAVFRQLKTAGVPIIRFAEFLWPGIAASDFPVTVELSRRVLMFPCHQELRAQELDWIIDNIKQALRAHGTTTT